MTGKERCYIDVCWPGIDMGLEYQGEDHGEQLGEDYARYYALDELGYQVFYVAKEQLRSADQMLYIAAKVARKLKARPGRTGWPEKDNLQMLLDLLTPAPGCIEFERVKGKPRAAPRERRR